MKSLRRLAAAFAVLSSCAGLATADDLRDFCADRPGLGTPTCIVDKGRVVIETGIADWTRENDGGVRTDTTMFGETLVRYGLTDTLEVQAGWDGYGLIRSRDRAARETFREDGSGDMSLALRQSLRNPDGSGFSLAAMPYVTLPTGSDAFTAGDWGAGLIVPISVELKKGLTLGFTPEVDAAVDGDGDGRHLAFGSVVGLGISVTDKLSLALEASLLRDHDPDGASTVALAGVALAWQVKDDLQLDIGLAVGLNDNSSDTQVYGGIAKRF